MTQPEEPFTITITDPTHVRISGRGADATVTVPDAERAAAQGAETLRLLGRTVEIVRA